MDGQDIDYWLGYLRETDGEKGIATYRQNSDKAWRMLTDQPDYQGMKVMLNGQKTISFYECIMGEDACCIDGHARNIAYLERVNLTDNKSGIGKKEYAMLQDAYRMAAKKLRYQNKRLKAYELQAVTWVAWRRIHGIK